MSTPGPHEPRHRLDPISLMAVRRRNHWVNHLARNAHQNPDGAFLRFAGNTVTWAEQFEKVERLAAGLAGVGVGPGERVMIMMANRPEFVDLVLAAGRLGAIAVPVNFRLSGEETRFLIEDCAPRLLVTDEVAGPAATAATAESGTVPLYATVAMAGARPYADLVSAAGDHPLVEVREDSPALIMYTSGTTGRPKGAVLSHLNMLSQSITALRERRLHGHTTLLCASPLFHIAGIGSLAPSLLTGGTLVLQPSGNFDPGALLDLFERERVTDTFLVPTQWAALCADPSVPQRDLSSLRSISWGAAPASTTLLARMAEVFPQADIIAFFGQTEMSPVTLALEAADAVRKIGSVGRPVAGVAVRVVDDLMKDVAPGEVGEIVYQGPGTMLEYWGNPTATAEAFAGGWFHSGDLVRVDDEGFFYVVDRKKDMIITGGENVYCAEVENALAAHPSVAEVSVVGAPHESWGETPVAFVVLHAGAELDVAGLREWATQRLARYKLPTVLHVVDALPRNATGKVLKAPLRERARG